MAYSLKYPSHGCLRVAQQLAFEGVQVSLAGVRGVWSHHKLLTKHERLLRLEQTVAKRRIKLSDEQIRLLERFSPEFRESPIPLRTRESKPAGSRPLTWMASFV